ncbi:MAG: 4Fe-4S binding protein, partial [Bacteroidales bacterium]
MNRNRKYIFSGLLLSICIVGHWLNFLGYIALAFALLILISPVFYRKNSCKTLCPRRSFLDTVVGPYSFHRKIPRFLTKPLTRKLILGIFTGMLITRLFITNGQVGVVFVGMCTVSTLAAVLLGVLFKPRSWCTVCPVGESKKMIDKT